MKHNVHYRKLNEELKENEQHLKEQLKLKQALWKVSGQMAAQGMDWMGGSMVTMGFSTVLAGLKLLTKGLEKIYDLQERWTAAIGNFRRTIGPATQATSAFEATAARLNMPLQELGYSFEEAHKQVGDFIQGFGFADEAANKWAKTAVELGVATGIGAKGVGELSRTMMLMGMTQAKQQMAFQEMVESANAAGVSVADFSNEMVGAKESVAEFGETGRKMFVGAAAWARRLGVSIKSLQNIIKLTDTFESAAGAAAKLNTVFGTSINSMDLMLEQDPAKRFNMLRDSLIGVGKDMKNLSRLEKKLVADTLGMTIEETNAFLTSGKDYNKFMAEKARKEEQAAKNTEWMNEMMAKAQNTIKNWDAFAQKLIKTLQPLTDIFVKGLGKGFETVGKAANTFGDNVLAAVTLVRDQILGDSGATKVIEDLGKSARLLFDEIFNKDNIISFVGGLKSLFTMFGSLVNWITQLAASPAIKLISWIIEKIGAVGHIVAGAWAGAKLGMAAGSLFGPVGTVVGGIAGALIGGGGAAVAGSVVTADQRREEAIQGKMRTGMSRGEAEAALESEQQAESDAQVRAGGFWTGGGFGAHQPITVGEHGTETIVPSTGGAVIPGGGLSVAATAPIVLKVQLDSREIQRIPFNTAFPVNVSVVGV